MAIRIKIYTPSEPVNLPIVVLHERSNTARHDVDDRMLDVLLFNNHYALLQRSHVIVNGLCRAKLLRNMDFEAVSVVIGEFHNLTVFNHTLTHPSQCPLIHAAGAVGLTYHMVLDALVILVVLGQLIDESLVTAICTERLCSYQEDVLDGAFRLRMLPAI